MDGNTFCYNSLVYFNCQRRFDKGDGSWGGQYFHVNILHCPTFSIFYLQISNIRVLSRRWQIYNASYTLNYRFTSASISVQIEIVIVFM